jgi:hypothetical protein
MKLFTYENGTLKTVHKDVKVFRNIPVFLSISQDVKVFRNIPVFLSISLIGNEVRLRKLRRQVLRP